MKIPNGIVVSLLRFTSILVLLICVSPVSARIWHVTQKELSEIESTEQFRTISEAVSKVEPGDTILIYTGTYREGVSFQKSGLPDKPITLKAAEGAYVVLTGADRITKWTTVPDEPHVYVTDWPYVFIGWTEHHTHPGDAYHRLIGRCEQVFVDGYLLRQVLERDKLTRDTFFVDLDAKRLYVRPAGDQDITSNKAKVEASTRSRILSVKGNHILIKGLRFRYAANRAQEGAVQLAGNHSTVADCVFEYTNSSGAEFTGQDITLERCTFQHNGQLGFGASGAHHLHLNGCICRNNNTKGFSRGWEAGGNKICMSRGVVIEHSTFIENRGNGIWFDIGNEACKVHNCLIAFNEDSGIFYEISYGLHVHDNVIVGNGLADSAGSWGAGAGVSLSSSPMCTVERNLIVGNREGFNFREQTRSTPRIGRRNESEAVWNHDQTIRHNVLAYNRDAQVWGWFDIGDERHWPKAMQTETDRDMSLEDLKLTFTDNLYGPGPGQGLFNWGVTWKKHERYNDLNDVRNQLGLGQGSQVADFEMADFSALDFRIPQDSLAFEMDCYPKGDVPGLRLGVNRDAGPRRD